MRWWPACEPPEWRSARRKPDRNGDHREDRLIERESSAKTSCPEGRAARRPADRKGEQPEEKLPGTASSPTASRPDGGQAGELGGDEHGLAVRGQMVGELVEIVGHAAGEP